MTGFTGFPAELLEFFDGLRADNSKSYWLDHKALYDSCVAAPMRALGEALTPEFGTPKIFRPYRDVRFSKDKRAYKEQASLVVDGSHGALYLQVSPDGLLLAGGAYQPAAEQLQRWRELQDEPVVAADLDRTLARLAAAGFAVNQEGSLKTAPRGWPRDHDRVELLRLRQLTVSRTWAPAAWWDTPKALSRVVEGWRQLQVWNDWLGKQVGPRSEPR